MNRCPACGSARHLICAYNEYTAKRSQAEWEMKTMSDFKIGDVVRFQASEHQALVDLGKGYLRDGEHVLGEIHAGLATGKLAGYPEWWHLTRFALVSRPSEAKPAFFKKGDRVLTEGGINGTISGVHDTRGYWVRMDGDNQPGDMYWLTECLKPIPSTPAPALKVGDRVRIKAVGWEGVTGVLESITPWHRVKHDSPHERRAGSGGPGRSNWTADTLELLPPEPASMGEWGVCLGCKGSIGNSYGWCHECATNGFKPKPMTATEASIRAQNAKAPPEYRYTGRELEDRLDALRYTMQNTLMPKLLQDLAPDSGWMPAGTYMPLKESDAKAPKRPAKRISAYQDARLAAGGYCSDGRTSVIADPRAGVKCVKPRFPERTRLMTRSWDPGYSELEDAE